MALAPFPIDPHLTAVAIAYRNKRLIADEVLPRVPVSKQEFRYLEHSLAESFTVPDTKVGRRSRPNEVNFSAAEKTASTEDYGLDDSIPQRDIDNKPENYDPLARSTESLTDLILLDREVRVAGVVFNPNTYPTARKKTLSGAGQWSHTDSDPIREIMEALDGQIMRPTIMVIGRAGFSILAQHPKIVKAVHGNSGDSGIARREAIQDLFELEAILVGEGYVNTARKGQAVSLSRVWGKHAALIYRDSLADASRGTTFGLTGEFGRRRSGSRPDADIGLDGGVRVRVGESVKELVTAPDLGFFFQNVVE